MAVAGWGLWWLWLAGLADLQEFLKIYFKKKRGGGLRFFFFVACSPFAPVRAWGGLIAHARSLAKALWAWGRRGERNGGLRPHVGCVAVAARGISLLLDL